MNKYHFAINGIVLITQHRTHFINESNSQLIIYFRRKNLIFHSRHIFENRSNRSVSTGWAAMKRRTTIKWFRNRQKWPRLFNGPETTGGMAIIVISMWLASLMTHSTNASGTSQCPLCDRSHRIHWLLKLSATKSTKHRAETQRHENTETQKKERMRTKKLKRIQRTGLHNKTGQINK